MPVRVKKMRRNKNLEPRSDSVGTETALGFAYRAFGAGSYQQELAPLQ
jgi:hypothetical protein